MNVRPCETKSPCFDPSNPLGNYSTEAPDPPVFIGIGWPWVDQNNPIDGGGGGNLPPPWYFAEGCESVCLSQISQEDADLCAAREAFICSHGGGGGGGGGGTTFFYSALQVCNFTCPDGTVYSYRVFAGSFINTTQAAADEQAAAYACRMAAQTRICLSNIENACLNEAYFQIVTTSGRGLAPFQFSIIGGALPPGLTFTQISETEATVTGTPNTAGVYTFRVRALDTRGDFMEKDYTLSIMGIDNSPDAAQVGVAYSFQYSVAGGTPPYTFVIDAGSLPDGLTMNSSGHISGTPTTAGSSSYTVSVSDSTP